MMKLNFIKNLIIKDKTGKKNSPKKLSGFPGQTCCLDYEIMIKWLKGNQKNIKAFFLKWTISKDEIIIIIKKQCQFM